MSRISSRRTATAAADNHWAWPSPPDPGDLSRRLAARRAELRLSIPQVARQAQVSTRYLEYLEKFPAQPGVPILRRLAAALRTTPTALLGAGGEKPDGRLRASGYVGASGRLEGLFPAECRRLLAPGGVGRIAFVAAAGLMVLPVNYVIAAGTVVFRTGIDSLIAAHGDDQVAFEADHLDETLGQGWSVLVRGRAHRVLQPGELRNVQRDCEPRPWPAGEHDLYIRIIPEHISGRRIRTQ
jgi:nitroimidazol reductase NimA-like FMN-containing flavoprotein (pyridoxamine 5'-phosphate oxidase superfamily)